MQNKVIIQDNNLLLSDFNNRNSRAFGEVYSLFYNELHYFTAQLYRDAPFVAKDLIQDIFLELWQNNKQQFSNLINIKAYIYVSIKNKFKNDINHKKYIEKHRKEVQSNQESFVSTIVETETLSILNEAIDFLPEECAKVFKLHLDGWQVKEIAQLLGKTESTIYSQRQVAISILRKKISKQSFLQFFLLLS